LITRAEIEAYIERKMRQLCADGDEATPPGPSRAEELFAPSARFGAFVDALGPPTLSRPISNVEAVPPLRDSSEHHFRLGAWPEHEFVVCESIDGRAWGQRFERANASSPPPLRVITDLGRWSHTLPEVLAVFGKPTVVEGWWPWNSANFVLDGREISLCFVFNLLQRILVYSKGVESP